MGNHHSNSSSALKRRLSRSSSTTNAETEDNTAASLVPIEKLTKKLTQMSSDIDSVNGITCRAFMRALFPRYPELGLRLFGYLHVNAGSTVVDCISSTGFKIHVEKHISILDDNEMREAYVKMFAACKPNIDRENFHDLLMTVYRLSMDYYPEGPQTCRKVYEVLEAAMNSAYHNKSTLSVGYATSWLNKNCPRLMITVHKYVVHVLTTAYRTIQCDPHASPRATSPAGLELSTPVLEKGWNIAKEQGLPLSLVWLLSTSLPLAFNTPQQAHVPPGPLPTSPTHLLCKMMGTQFQFPSHWVPLYNSDNHGCGANRFMNHVFSYRGPTLTFISCAEAKFLIAADQEWRENHQYWGGPDCMLLQLWPEYHVIETGPKTIFMNITIRGYPQGMRFGADPRKPSLTVDQDFFRIVFKDIPFAFANVEVWGCGMPEQRTAQLEVKKWEVKEAERQRVVKLDAKDWVDHPDRYLLELNGRTVYNAS